ACDVLAVTGQQLDARRVATECRSDVERQTVDVRIDVRVGGERVAVRAAQRGDELSANARGIERDRQRSPRAPEANAVHQGPIANVDPPSMRRTPRARRATSRPARRAPSETSRTPSRSG